MTKGIRNSEATKIEAARRFRKGEDPTVLAKEYGVVESTLEDWEKQFKNKRGKRLMTKPKRKTIISNGVSNGEVTELKRTIIELSVDLQFWQNYTLKLIREKESQ